MKSRELRAQPLDRPSMLLAVKPDVLDAFEQVRVVQSVGLTTKTLIKRKATPSAVLKHLKSHQFVHVICNSNFKAENPLDAFFELYGGTNPSLLDIVRSGTPTAEFAFLPGCHMAEVTNRNTADEELHLAGMVQYCGFRSVVGTMWEMASDDDPVVARSFYQSVFSNRWQGVPYYERTAEALRDAVKVLRRKRGMALERWVNFVHYGA
jgi:CHAT domain-containing protein